MPGAVAETNLRGSGPREPRYEIEAENPTNNWVEGLPHLFPLDSNVRYAPFDGRVWIATYHERAGITNAAYKRWTPYSSLGDATDATAEALNRHDRTGTAVANVRSLDQFVRDRLGQFDVNGAQEDQITEFQLATDAKLNELWFKPTKKVDEKKIEDHIRIAMAMEQDKLGPLIVRTQRASYILTLLLSDELAYDRTSNMYLRRFVQFLGEQQLEEAYVTTVVAELSEGNLRPTALHEAALKPIIKASPYRIPVMHAYAVFFGVPPERREEFDNYFGDDILREALNDKGIPQEEHYDIVIANLKKALKKGASMETPSV